MSKRSRNGARRKMKKEPREQNHCFEKVLTFQAVAMELIATYADWREVCSELSFLKAREGLPTSLKPTLERLRISASLGYREYFAATLTGFLRELGILVPIGVFQLDPLGGPRKGRPISSESDLALHLKECGASLEGIAWITNPCEAERADGDLSAHESLKVKTFQLVQRAEAERESLESAAGIEAHKALRHYLHQLHEELRKRDDADAITAHHGPLSHAIGPLDLLRRARTRIICTREHFEEGAKAAISNGLVLGTGLEAHVNEMKSTG